MKTLFQILVISIILLSIASCKNEVVLNKNIPQGIWIAKDFYNSFEKTNSIIESKKAFDSSNPVGLRINYQEVKDTKLNIGYSFLHSHLIRPEVSEFAIKDNNDTIREQGNFRIDLSKVLTDNSFETTEIYPFCYEWKANIKYNSQTETITLFRPKNERYDTLSIEYVRIDSTFNSNYQFPNPLYFYTRRNLLCGNYLVKDTTGKTIENDFTINPNGLMQGFEQFENNTIFYSTDVFCGEPVLHDLVIIEEDLLKEDGKTSAFGFNRKDNGDIELRKNRISEEVEGEIIYELIKN